MTQDPAVQAKEPFEEHPALASWIERMANTNMGLSLGEWMIFVGALNTALSAERARAEAAERERDEAQHVLMSIDEHEGLVARVLLERERARASALEKRVGVLEAAVNEAAATFRRYQASHMTKALPGDAESAERIAKSRANADLAAMCEAALAVPSPADKGEEAGR